MYMTMQDMWIYDICDICALNWGHNIKTRVYAGLNTMSLRHDLGQSLEQCHSHTFVAVLEKTRTHSSSNCRSYSIVTPCCSAGSLRFVERWAL
jgi:hypothetical protein